MTFSFIYRLAIPRELSYSDLTPPEYARMVTLTNINPLPAATMTAALACPAGMDDGALSTNSLAFAERCGP